MATDKEYAPRICANEKCGKLFTPNSISQTHCCRSCYTNHRRRKNYAAKKQRKLLGIPAPLPAKAEDELRVVKDAFRHGRVRIIVEITDLYPELCPRKGCVYEAEFYRGPMIAKKGCVVTMLGKRIYLKPGEYIEVVDV